MIEFKKVARASLEALKRDETVALASIVRVKGSSPRHNGARMLIWPDGRMVGTIGGGTLEYRVVEDARVAMAEGVGRYSNYVFDPRGRPGSVGLCGGSVDVHIDVTVRNFADVAGAALQALEDDEIVALASIVHEGDAVQLLDKTHMLIWSDGRTFGSLGGVVLDDRVLVDAQEALTERTSRSINYACDDTNVDLESVIVHLDVLSPDRTLLIVGAGHVSQPLAAIGSLMGMRVYVVDDREEWANPERFPTATEIAVIDYEPNHEILDPIPFPMTPTTYVVITTWGYDLPVMEQAMQQNPAYIGLVASPVKAKTLFKRMRDAGFADERIRQIRAPVGLDVGAESPAEIAVSIMAEILTVVQDRGGRPLQEVRGKLIDDLFAGPAPTT